MDLAVSEIETETWNLTAKLAWTFCLISHDVAVKTLGAELMLDYFSIQNPAPFNKSSV